MSLFSPTIAFGIRPVRNLSSKRAVLFAWLTCTLGFFLDTGELALNNALGAIATSASPASSGVVGGALSLLLSAPYVGGALGAIVLGQFAQRYDLRHALLIAVLILSAASFASTLTTDVATITVLRGVAGLGIGAYPPLAITYLTRIFPRERRGRPVLLAAGFGAIGGVAATLGVRHFTQWPVAGYLGWQTVLLGCAILGVAVAIMFLLTPVAALVGKAIEEPLPAHLASRPANRAGWCLFLIFFLNPIANVGFASLSGAVMVQKGMLLKDALLFVSAMMFGPPIGLFLSSIFVDRFRRGPALVGATLVGALTILVFGLTESPWLIGGSAILLGVALGFQVPTLMLFATELYPPADRARASSRLWSLNRISTALGPLVLVPLLLLSGPIAFAVCISLVFLICATLIFIGGSNSTIGGRL